jgi:hypothetical protein
VEAEAPSWKETVLVGIVELSARLTLSFSDIVKTQAVVREVRVSEGVVILYCSPYIIPVWPVTGYTGHLILSKRFF